MARTWKRWLPAAVVPAVIAGGALIGTVQAGAATELPDKTPQQLLELLAGSDVRTLSGTLEQTSALGLPQLPTDGPDQSGMSGAAAALDLLTGSHTARVYLDGKEQARVQVLDRLAERDIIRNGRDVWFYSSKQNEAVHMTLPERSGAKEHDKYDGEYTPERLASHFLEAVEPGTEVTVAEDVRVAGRDAYQLVLDPDSAETLVDSVSLAVDAETGLPLSVEVQARGQEEPAFELAFTELSLEAPDAGLFDFTPPAGATVTEHAVPDRSGRHADRGERQGPDAAQRDARHHDAKHRDGKVEKTGEGWDTVVELSATSLPEGWAESPAMAQALRKVDGGQLLSTALVNVLLTDDGRVFAGSVTVERLQAAAEGR
ncbi:hypothetical protein D477_012375 [Arthrobacter crystallopoietes BAB-32]|uniref:MucB/RseB N-terminal domain-containing protein n=1 Tax=Arthrobacter crystallopoietes BAB-32 TaxID=1246476 RepID=N1V1Q7_9MICC|nr:sigma-E factor regulatory protein RseB domain-containing protein [Arthrobacter crystallopoietes]EMY33924.1 hypothetical protein D477_012375 [Arthrobacter crystallopoietes BAB-32]